MPQKQCVEIFYLSLDAVCRKLVRCLYIHSSKVIIMAGFRDERIGAVNAARLLGVTVKELKDAVQQETLLRGVEPPKVFFKAGQIGTQLVFRAGDVMDVADKLAKEKMK